MMGLPEPFARKIEIDKRCAQPVVDIRDIIERRRTRRYCQVFLSAPSAPSPVGGGTPIAIAE